jgi:hypothetical protein
MVIDDVWLSSRPQHYRDGLFGYGHSKVMPLKAAVLLGLSRDLALTMCQLRWTQGFDVHFLHD